MKTLELYPREFRHRAAKRLNAIETLKSVNASVGQDFYTLKAAQVDALLVDADRVRYRKPKLANKSRAHCYYDLLQRNTQL